MEFMNRSGQPVTGPAVTPAHTPTSKSRRPRGKVIRIVSAILLISIALLIAALAAYVVTSSNSKEADLVAKDRFQAVFLNGGQVYFGKVRELNKSYITMDNIYYLRVNQQGSSDANAQNQQQDITLAKLGCELHGPQDFMAINRDQVTFWENLKDDGQVAKAIADFVKKYPNGQDCKEQQPTQ